MPPGIYFWKLVKVRTADDEIAEIWRLHRRPLAACKEDLEDEDILSLLDELHGMARNRGLDLGHLHRESTMSDEDLISKLAGDDPERIKAARLLLGEPEGFPEPDETRH